MKPESVIHADYLRATAVDYAKRFIGIPYAWAGDDPMRGFDCSGFIVEVLQSVGVLPHNKDHAAHDLYVMFKDQVVFLGYGGCLAFWFNAARTATHAMLLLDNQHVLGAAGGGSTTTTLPDAIRDNAFIKVRPLNYRGPHDIPIIVDPFMGAA